MRKFLVVTACWLSLHAVLTPSAWAGDYAWHHVGNAGTPGTAPLNGAVTALHADGTDLYVGGQFTDAGGVASADFVAKWNGTAWSGFAPLNGTVRAIAFAGGTLIVGGSFSDASGNPDADFLARWNGSAWEPACNAVGPAFNGNVSALQVIGNTLYVGGAFTNAAGIASADYLVACDLTSGSASSTIAIDGNMSASIDALAADDNGTLYVGGGATNIDGNPAIDYVGAYDGAWHALGSGPGVGGGAIGDRVRALASDGTNVYVGTDALDIAGIAGANYVAKWNGAAWSGMQANYFSTPTTIFAIAIAGSLVFAAGNFQDADGDPLADAIVYWDGSAWHPAGSNGAGNGPLSANALALATLGPRIIAGGSFMSAGADALAKFVAQTPIAPIVVFVEGFEAPQ